MEVEGTGGEETEQGNNVGEGEGWQNQLYGCPHHHQCKLMKERTNKGRERQYGKC